MRRVNRECIVCGKHYEYCSGCAGSDPAWKTIYCCEDCREISHVLSDYNGGILPLEEANTRLNKCELSKLDKLDKSSRKIANEILGIQEDKKEEIVIEPVEVESTCVVAETSKVESANNYNPNYRNKKNKNKKNGNKRK